MVELGIRTTSTTLTSWRFTLTLPVIATTTLAVTLPTPEADGRRGPNAQRTETPSTLTAPSAASGRVPPSPRPPVTARQCPTTCLWLCHSRPAFTCRVISRCKADMCSSRLAAFRRATVGSSAPYCVTSSSTSDRRCKDFSGVPTPFVPAFQFAADGCHQPRSYSVRINPLPHGDANRHTIFKRKNYLKNYRLPSRSYPKLSENVYIWHFYHWLIINFFF